MKTTTEWTHSSRMLFMSSVKNFFLPSISNWRDAWEENKRLTAAQKQFNSMLDIMAVSTCVCKHVYCSISNLSAEITHCINRPHSFVEIKQHLIHRHYFNLLSIFLTSPFSCSDCFLSIFSLSWSSAPTTPLSTSSAPLSPSQSAWKEKTTHTHTFYTNYTFIKLLKISHEN